MAQPRDREQEIGPSAIVAALLGYMPGPTHEARTAAWHQAFFEVRNEFESRLPELRSLHFYTRPGLPPISAELEDIFQSLAMWGLSEIKNPRLMVRTVDQPKLKELAAESVEGRLPVITEAAEELQRKLADASRVSEP